jgi:hypothetical protein
MDFEARIAWLPTLVLFQYCECLESVLKCNIVAGFQTDNQ